MTLCLGFIGFSAIAFWLCLYYQVVQEITPLSIAARMLPMAIVGILVNVVAGFIMHIVSNKLLMSIGALAYCGCFALLSAMPANGLYWAFAFPALCLSVVGADFQFTVTNVRLPLSLPPLSFHPFPSRILLIFLTLPDVRRIRPALLPPIDSRRHPPNRHPDCHLRRARHPNRGIHQSLNHGQPRCINAVQALQRGMVDVPGRCRSESISATIPNHRETGAAEEAKSTHRRR